LFCSIFHHFLKNVLKLWIYAKYHYQISENIEKKLYLAFLLKDLFKKDKLLNVYSDELPNILQTIDLNEIPERYEELVKESLDKKIATAKQIKFDNDILHRSKVLKHFLENDEKLNRTKKDFKKN